MIARIGYCGDLTPEQEATGETNLRERFKRAITSQDGFVAAYWLRGADGRLISFPVWESEDELREGGARANTVPLLPGQIGVLMPSPECVEICAVVDRS